MSPEDGRKVVCIPISYYPSTPLTNTPQPHPRAHTPITTLPPELITLILLLLPHVADLRNTLLASPLFVVGYTGSERLILTNVLYNEIGQCTPKRSIQELVDSTLRLGHRDGILERMIDAEGWMDGL